MQEKIWKYKNEKLKPEDIEEISKKYRIPRVLSTIILNRGISEEQDVMPFLSKSMKCVHNPNLMLDMEKATQRIKSAIENNEKIIVYGDYDVDGITSTALMYMYLKELGANISYYIPDRVEEGYGINIMAINRFIKDGVKLVITVDCGITAVGEVEFGKLQGLDMVITDHHTCKEKIPNAAAIINPKRPDCKYPFDGLAGVGVAFKLVLALSIAMGLSTKDTFDKYVEIAAIGTIADVVPLLGENRVIVDRGLKALANTKREGLKALLEISGADKKPINASTIAFMIAPRLNAAGRLGTATTAVELLLTDDRVRAYEIAKELDNENRQRQLTEQKIFEDALDLIKLDPNFDKKNVIVLSKEGWHHGVIGIVASRINDMFYRPCVLISHENGVCKGSGRSIPTFNLFDALNHCDELLTNFGGHSVAAGLGLNLDNLETFDKKINEYAKNTLTDDDLIPKVSIDCAILPSEVTIESVKILANLEPFGMGNSKPVFSITGLNIYNIGQMGIENKHLRVRFNTGNRFINGVGFGMGGYMDEFSQGDIVDVAFCMDINNYQGNENVQIILKDIKKTVLA